MPENEEQTSEEQTKKENWCPFCSFVEAVSECKHEHTEFFDHMKKAEVEVLTALRSLIDARIKQHEEKPPKQATKIVVE